MGVIYVLIDFKMATNEHLVEDTSTQVKSFETVEFLLVFLPRLGKKAELNRYAKFIFYFATVLNRQITSS